MVDSIANGPNEDDSSGSPSEDDASWRGRESRRADCGAIARDPHGSRYAKDGCRATVRQSGDRQCRAVPADHRYRGGRRYPVDHLPRVVRSAAGPDVARVPVVFLRQAARAIVRQRDAAGGTRQLPRRPRPHRWQSRFRDPVWYRVASSVVWPAERMAVWMAPSDQETGSTAVDWGVCRPTVFRPAWAVGLAKGA